MFNLLCRIHDVGKSKAEVAAIRVMERISGVNIVPHFCRIEDKDIEFYRDFNIIALGLDSIEARSYINSVACSFLGDYLLFYCSKIISCIILYFIFFAFINFILFALLLRPLGL